MRALAVNALRLASVLIGAGLLLRTASSEYVASAPPEPSRTPGKFVPALRPMPEPAFGQATSMSAPAPSAKPRSAAIAASPVRSAQGASGPVPTRLVSAAPSDQNDAAVAASALRPAAPAITTPAITAPAEIASEAAPAIAPGRPLPDPGLLAPVRIVSGAPVVARPSEPPVQISLAPPSMRPGPRTTALTSDVRTEMRRPASAWDYAEALSPELSGRSGAAQARTAVPAAATALADPADAGGASGPVGLRDRMPHPAF